MPFSIVILTLNEERDLPACLDAIRFCDDIVVLDSGSTDSTIAIAKTAGARVFTRRFDNFGGQRNFAQTKIPFKHAWVFHLDADEIFNPALAAECEASSGRTDLDGFYVAPKMIWEGTWVPHCTDFPAWQARFVRAPDFRFIEVGHGQREAAGMRLERLTHSYDHNLSSGGTTDWLAKHRRYAAAEAKNYLSTSGRTRAALLFSSEKLERRRALKRLSYSLPFRPLLRFVYQYFLRGGILDGGAGLKYCLLLARYEGFTSAEIRRLKRVGI
jgi:glycosyltransferase involved in cell wall biosynthesis